MSRETRDRVWDSAVSTGSQKLMLLALAEHADARGVCWPGMDVLIQKMGIVKRSVQRLLADIEATGEIFSIARGGGKPGGYFVAIGLEEWEIVAVLMEHSRFNFDAQTAQELAREMVSRVTLPSPLNRQSRVTHMSSKGDVDVISRVTDTSFKGDVDVMPIQDEPSINRQLEPEENEARAPQTAHSVNNSPPPKPPQSESQQLDFKAFQMVTGWMFGTRSREQNQQLQLSMQHLREKDSPPATPENIALFGQRWRETGRTKPTPGQVVTSWEDILTPPKANQNGNIGIQTGPPRPGYSSPRQQAERVREQQRNDLMRSFER